MKALLVVTAIVEGLTGISLLVMPSITASLLLGVEIVEPVGQVVGRIAGAALVALATVCWQAREGNRGGVAIGVVAALLFYNAAAASILAFAGIRLGLQSSVLWPAIVRHNVLAAWCLFVLWRTRTEVAKS